MPTTTDDQVDDQEIEDLDSPGDLPEFAPGELCPVDATDERIDLTELDDEQIGCLEALAKRCSDRDQTSYRIEVRDAWKERYFYRGNQYLLAGKNGSWVTPKSVLMSGQSYDDSSQETNIYLAFGDTIAAALTAGTPSVRFEADDAGNPADITAATKSDGARRLIERANDMITLQAELARFLWTDGRALYYTHHVLDAQRFGYGNTEYDEELSFMEDSDAVSADEEPRSQQIIECFGALEVKLPIQAKDIHGCDFLQLGQEFDVSRLKTKYPDSASKITAAAAPSAQSDYVRLARTSVNMGMRPANMTNDAQGYNATETLTWVRPSFYETEENDAMKSWLLSDFPKGVMIALVGKTVVEARTESIDDHWTLFHARPGDGMHRPSLGRPVVPMQEKLNDCMDLVHESYMHLIPRIWVDSHIDAEAIERTERKPGQYMKAPKSTEGKAIGDNFFAEPNLQVAEGLISFIEKLFGEFTQFLCGAFPALFGGNTGSNDTAAGIAQQRDQALGRLGLTWRGIKGGYARVMRQAVVGVSKNQKGKFAGEVPTGTDGKKEYLEISTDDLKGNIKCFPDTDENFPESWVAQRAVWNTLLQQAEKNPIIAKLISLPKNLLTMKDKTGTPELVVPEAASERKQLAEIKILLAGEPQPNPAVAKAQQALQGLQGGIAAGMAPPQAPQLMQVAQQKVAAMPQLISSVPINKLLDFHVWEAQAIQTFANSEEGIKAAEQKPQGFANMQLHYEEHMAEAKAQAAAAAQPPPVKPPSESINFKDMPPEGKVQMAEKDGIHLDAAKLAAEDAQDKQTEATAAAAKISGASGPPKSGKQESGG